MKFYYINSDYIHYLKQFESKIQSNYDSSGSHQKPYIGVVLEINDFQYFAPLTSPKDKFRSIPDSNPALFKITANKSKLIGVIALNNMIPVKENTLSPVVFSRLDEQYKNLLLQQYRIISSKTVTEIVQKKAKDLYRLVTELKHPHFVKLSCNFKFLENKLSHEIDKE